MHGLINRSIQCFVTDSYGQEPWHEIARAAELGFDSFEALLTYDPAVTQRVLDATAAHLSSPQDMVLEDLGTYLVSHPRMAVVRRLLRLGGETFPEFLYSLDDLHDRVRLAVSDLQFPVLELKDHFASTFTLSVSHEQAGFGHVLVGILRAMADDYGALVFLEYKGRRERLETIAIELVEADFAEGRDFDLAVAQ